MCDYSLHAVATRPAEVAETLISTNFSTGTHGFASPGDPKVAVCLRPGTEIAFENDVQTDGLMFRKNIGDRLAYGPFRLLAAFLGLLAKPGCIVGHADQIGDARNDFQRIRVMVAEG
jgi:hypothetical protein